MEIAPDFTSRIDEALRITTCKKHNAPHDYACHVIESSSGNILRGICNARAKRAGFIGKITSGSFSRKPQRK